MDNGGVIMRRLLSLLLFFFFLFLLVGITQTEKSEDTNYSSSIHVYTQFDLRGKVYKGKAEVPSNNCPIDSYGPIRVNPDSIYYGGQLDTYVDGTCGVFLDSQMNVVSLLRREDVKTLYPSNKGPYFPATDDITRQWNIPPIYFFKTPHNANYLIKNTLKDTNKYQYEFITNKLMIANSLMGNIIISGNDPNYKKKKDKNLCVIGPSHVMLDRQNYKASSGNGEMDKKTFVGFQEYLAPYYHSVRSFGYSGGAWGMFNDDEYLSVYSGIIIGNGREIKPKNFRLYDDIVLIGENGNGFSDNEYIIGDVESEDIKTFIGGLRGVVKYIRSQNPEASIFLTSPWIDPKCYTTKEEQKKQREAIEKLPKLAKALGLSYINLLECNFNYNNYSKEHMVYSYDGTHPNNEAMKIIGEVLIKRIIYNR